MISCEDTCRIKTVEKSKQIRSGIFILFMYLWVFQRPMESVCGWFSYIDEFTALIGAFLGFYDIIVVRKGYPSKAQLWIGIPLMFFAAVGLMGNLIYQYQPLKCVIIDGYTNLKFFFAIGTGYYLSASMHWETMRKSAAWNARLIALVLFALFLADRWFHLWPAEVRYGISSAVLFYNHPTYLVGAMVFLLVVLTIFYEKKNLPCIAMALTLMFFSLRAKSIASAAVYVLMFVFFLVFRWELRLWHVIVAGVGSIVIAWNQIRYYFITLAGHSARSVMLLQSIEAMKDHFPLGTGFGTYGSAEAAKHYSPVYVMYGLHQNYELRDVTNIDRTIGMIEKSSHLVSRFQNDPEGTLYGNVFLMDSFWPTIFAQVGILGTVAFLVVLGVIVKRCLEVAKFDCYGYVGVLFIMVYLAISSIAEPAFFNSVAIPLAVVMGMVFSHMDAQKFVL